MRLATRRSDLVNSVDRTFQSQLNSQQAGQFAESSFQPAFGAGTVVANDVQHQRIVEFPGGFQAVNQSSDVMVGVSHETSIIFHQSQIDRLRFRRLVFPGGKFRGARCELGTSRNDAQFQLPGMRQLSLFIPSVIELAFEHFTPLGRRMMRRVNRSSTEVTEPGLFRIRCADVSCPSNRLVRDVLGEVVTLFRSFRLIDGNRISIERWIVLMRFTLVESVKVLEPQACRPAIKWSGRTDVHLRSVVPLAEHRRGITVIAERLRDQTAALGNDAGVAWITRTAFRNHAGADRMVIASSQQRTTSRTA